MYAKNNLLYWPSMFQRTFAFSFPSDLSFTNREAMSMMPYCTYWQMGSVHSATCPHAQDSMKQSQVLLPRSCENHAQHSFQLKEYMLSLKLILKWVIFFYSFIALHFKWNYTLGTRKSKWCSISSVCLFVFTLEPNWGRFLMGLVL